MSDVATPRGPNVHLVEVTDRVLDDVVRVAVAGAEPDDVTPPLGDGWTQARTDWLRRFHRERSTGLGGDLHELTRAVVAGRDVVGAIRIQLLDLDATTAEIGVWIVRACHGRGIGTAAIVAACSLAAESGVTDVLARTTSDNVGARRVLDRIGFACSIDDDAVEATRPLPNADQAR